MARVSLADVARVAGVGKATASRSLSSGEHPDVRAETREHVRAVARELGYRPSSAAQALRTGRHGALSVAAPLADWAWWAPMLQGAAREAQALDYRLLIHPVESASAMRTLSAELENLPVDGLVVVTPGAESDDAELGGLTVPVVYVDDVTVRSGSVTIRSANRDGGQQAGRHLVARGRSRPLVIVPDPELAYVRERVEGLRDALAETGLSLPPDAVVTSKESFEDAEETSVVVQEVLDRGVPFDSVFAVSDYLAASAIRTLRRAGVDVPGDVSVVGFDDERAARLVDPRLTTVRQPLAELGAFAVRKLVSACTGGHLEPGVHELPVELVVRESS